MTHRLAWIVALTASLLVSLTGAAGATGDELAPIGRKGPKLSVPAGALAASLTCTPNVRRARTTPVLLLAGTAVDSDEYFEWNWKRALTKAGIPWCASDIPSPDSARTNLDDIQMRGEYITFAIRKMHKLARRDISIIGHSQGGVAPRWSLRFWPDTRKLVDDVIGLGPTNHGTSLGTQMCPAMCHPAIWQQRVDSQFIEAINSHQETFAGISYTVITSDLDALVPPSEANLSGPGDIANITVQDKCPNNTFDHDGIGTSDPVAEAIVMDALRHAGPARLDRIAPAVCAKTYMSGINPATYAAEFARMREVFWQNYLAAPRAESEPSLACYTLATRCRHQSATASAPLRSK